MRNSFARLVGPSRSPESGPSNKPYSRHAGDGFSAEYVSSTSRRVTVFLPTGWPRACGREPTSLVVVITVSPSLVHQGSDPTPPHQALVTRESAKLYKGFAPIGSKAFSVRKPAPVEKDALPLTESIVLLSLPGVPGQWAGCHPGVAARATAPEDGGLGGEETVERRAGEFAGIPRVVGGECGSPTPAWAVAARRKNSAAMRESRLTGLPASVRVAETRVH